MKLPYQSPSIDRANRLNSAIQQGVDPALFGLDWDDVTGGLQSAVRYLAPHAKDAAKDFAMSAIDGL
ncbi:MULTISPECIES: hypothetical protein [Stappiaceae]|uniref:Uncharacterized protein n=1 Tax=Roseibium polysiphoniae TaxID=2571221 RepID=A0A944C9Y2_9HYPH|nr:MULTISPECIES: hypothetical protein [Stappiaceae]MBD8875347.1 hypothetical protein [Roseibium polysiphoniae]MBS8259333.1 hypothetical protein [Roseibium polysiphoniae]